MAGHKRHAHVTAVRSGSVPPGRPRAPGEGAVRRAFVKGETEPYANSLHAHLDSICDGLLRVPCSLDMGGAVKPLYKAGDLCEYAVLVAPIAKGTSGIAQLYRDRGEAGSVFDELNSQET
jgi:hypothetical protein